MNHAVAITDASSPDLTSLRLEPVSAKKPSSQILKPGEISILVHEGV